MKIERIEAIAYNLFLIEPIRISFGVIDSAKNVLVKVYSEEHVGIGEAAPTLKIVGDNQEACLSFVEYISQLIVGEEPAVQCLSEKLSGYKMPSAIAAIDIAVHDLLGKHLSKPLYKVLGGCERQIDADITIGIAPPEVMRKKAEEAISRGFRVLKLKVQGDVEEDAKRVEAVGDLGVRIRVDANQGFSPKNALKFIRKIDKYDVELIEQPVPAWDLDGLKFVRDNSSIPVFADESAFSSKDVLKLVKLNAVDGVNIKLMKCGGITDAVKIVHIAEAADIECMVGCMLESKVSLTAAAHLAFAFNIKYVDLDAHLFLRDDPTVGGMEIERGKIRLPDKPGLGVEVKG